MAKKIFVTRNTEKTGRPPYVKFLLWAAVALVVLIIVAPLFQQKGNKGIQKSADKNGKVVREIPRTGLPSGDEAPQLPGQSPDLGRTGESRVMPIPPEIKGFTDAPPKGLPPEPTTTDKIASGEGAVKPEGEQGMAPVLPGSAPHKEVAVVPPDVGAPRAKPESPPGKPADSHESAPPKAKEVSPAAPGSRPAAEEPKVKASADKTLYTVQVGSFQEKRYADEMQQNLQKRGYKTVVKIKNHPKLGQVHVVQLEPVAGIDKANTLVAQIRSEQKVNPIIHKVQPGE